MGDPFSIRRHPAAIPLAVLVAFTALTPRGWAAPAGDVDEAKVTLHPGDPAPKLYISKWVKGEPVKEFEKGKVYVIECWASWCGPCKASIPHVTQMQAKYKDKGLTVIGLDVWEEKPDAGEEFVKEMGDKMGYTVAIDETDPHADNPTEAGKTAKAWLTAAGQNGIPCSFIVDKDGKVMWIGHPMSLEPRVEAVLAGTFDLKKEKELQAKLEALDTKVGEAVRAKDYDKAMSTLEEMRAADPSTGEQTALMKFSLLLQKKDYEAANKFAAELAGGEFKDNATSQGRLAMMLLNSPTPEKADADLALRMAEKAYAADPTDVSAQKAAALAYAAKKNFAKAAELQEKVVAKLRGPLGARETKLLEEYKQKAAGGGEK